MQKGNLTGFTLSFARLPRVGPVERCSGWWHDAVEARRALGHRHRTVDESGDGVGELEVRGLCRFERPVRA
jgi:hypothetical protein